MLARGFGNQLLEPGADTRNAGRRDERHLVTAGAGQRSQDGAEDDRGILLGRNACRTRMDHQLRAVEQPSDIDTHDRRWHQPEVREHGIAATDIRSAEEHLTKPLALGDAAEAPNRDR